MEPARAQAIEGRCELDTFTVSSAFSADSATVRHPRLKGRAVEKASKRIGSFWLVRSI